MLNKALLVSTMKTSFNIALIPIEKQFEQTMKYKIIATCMMFFTLTVAYFLNKYYQAEELVLGMTLLVGWGQYYYITQKEKEQERLNPNKE